MRLRVTCAYLFIFVRRRVQDLPVKTFHIWYRRSVRHLVEAGADAYRVKLEMRRVGQPLVRPAIHISRRSSRGAGGGAAADWVGVRDRRDADDVTRLGLVDIRCLRVDVAAGRRQSALAHRVDVRLVRDQLVKVLRRRVAVEVLDVRSEREVRRIGGRRAEVRKGGEIF